ncbi:MAG: thermonuclease family protein, partial [Caldilineaceae bacterium]|nr:thermonuclease family protein [Caldilineaceae bacterium]
PPPPATPTPTPTPLPTLSPTPWPTVDTGPSYASSVVSGTVHSVKVVDSDGRESTVQIDVVIGYGVNSGQHVGDSAPGENDDIPRLPGRGELAVVTHVRDGDTVEVRFSDGREEAIRLLDVDTPETKHPTKAVQCYGPEASNHTKERLCGDPSGDTCLGIEVQIEATGTDRYGRTLGYLWINGELYNAELTWLGLARYNDYGTKHQYSDRVAQAAAAAEAAGLGLWGACSENGEMNGS